jgi:hypothetical protein
MFLIAMLADSVRPSKVRACYSRIKSAPKCCLSFQTSSTKSLTFTAYGIITKAITPPATVLQLQLRMELFSLRAQSAFSNQ